MTLTEWGAYCEDNHESRRNFYKSAQYFNLEKVDSIAFFRKLFKSKDGDRSLKVYLVKEAIDQFKTDAVVNAANESLLGGGGVDQLLHESAGINLVRECALHSGCEVGNAVITKGYKLPAKHVLHTVAPLLTEDGYGDELKLTSCYLTCLDICNKYNFKSVVFPCLGCGFYSFPIEQSACLVKEMLKNYLEKEDSTVDTVILSTFFEKEREAYYKEFSQ